MKYKQAVRSKSATLQLLHWNRAWAVAVYVMRRAIITRLMIVLKSILNLLHNTAKILEAISTVSQIQ